MYLKEDNENKKVFVDETGVYTLLRNKNDLIEDSWILASYKSNDELNVQIEAIENEYGEYLKLIVFQGNMERSLLLDNGEVVDDKIKLFPGSRDAEESYEDSVFVNKINEREKVDKYLVKSHDFANASGKKFYGVVSNNYYLLNFLKYNKLLSRLSFMNANNPKKGVKF